MITQVLYLIGKKKGGGSSFIVSKDFIFVHGPVIFVVSAGHWMKLVNSEMVFHQPLVQFTAVSEVPIV